MQNAAALIRCGLRQLHPWGDREWLLLLGETRSTLGEKFVACSINTTTQKRKEFLVISSSCAGNLPIMLKNILVLLEVIVNKGRKSKC